MTNPLAQDLGGVVRLLEKATPGPWAYSKRNDPEWPASIISGMDTGRAYAVAMCPRYRNSDWSGDANAIIAAVNFLRTHSAEIAGALRDAERWRPIESAPRDGTYILLGHEGSHSEEGRWMGDASRNHWGETGWFASDDDVLCEHPSKPTHWRPLPAPPTLDSAMQRGGGGGDHG